VGVAVPLSLHEIFMHWSHYTVPHLQRHVIRILFMVPIYSIESWLALRFKDQAPYLQTAREAYEVRHRGPTVLETFSACSHSHTVPSLLQAYVIWSFMKLLSEFLGPADRMRAMLLAKEDQNPKLIFPLCWVRWQLPSKFLFRSSLGVFQYVVIRFFLSIATLILTLTKSYGSSFTDFGSPMVWFVVILNISQCWAMVSCQSAIFYASRTCHSRFLLSPSSLSPVLPAQFLPRAVEGVDAY